MTHPISDDTRSQELKTQAKRLRAALADDSITVSHSQALELLAQQQGMKDWNTLVASSSLPGSANTSDAPPAAKQPPGIGQAVTGRYLGQPFTGKVHAAKLMGPNGDFRITLQLDEPVDVVAFDSFSNFRSRISTLVNARGISPAKTSNGKPQLVVDW